MSLMRSRAESIQGALSLLAVLGSSALNYAFTLLLGRWLDLPGYAAFAAFTSLFMLTAALPIAFQQATARRADGANTRAALRAGTLSGGLLLLLAPLIGPRTGVPVAWVAAFALTVPALVLLGAWRGAAQREGRAAAFGWSLLVEHGAKVALTLPLLSALPGPAAPVTATLAGLLLALPVVRPRPAGRPVTPDRPASEGKVALTVVAAAQSALLYGDVLLAGALLPPDAAGTYAAAATLARVVFFAGWAVQVAAFPAVARRAAAGEPHTPLLGGALLATLLVAGLPALLLALAPDWSARLAFGGGVDAAPLLPLTAAGALLLALAATALNHALAAGGAGALWRVAGAYLTATAVTAACAALLVPDARTLALAALAGKLTLILTAAPALLSRRFPHVLPRL
ncbi:hypothetical protein GCM10008937_06970 [Deinococcus depolymerans]|uniref:Polysaccharide biosynthesis protein n=2 Tax=Deinococcus depolymerans TaxID=392408 RepID=A0ABN1BNQ2_9DEIO